MVLTCVGVVTDVVTDWLAATGVDILDDFTRSLMALNEPLGLVSLSANCCNTVTTKCITAVQ